MALKPGDVSNFETIKRAFKNRDVALMECTDAVTGEYVAVICAVQEEEGDNVAMVPLARMFAGNPYAEVLPPEIEEA
jgi:hypothetical protein